VIIELVLICMRIWIRGQSALDYTDDVL